MSEAFQKMKLRSEMSYRNRGAHGAESAPVRGRGGWVVRECGGRPGATGEPAWLRALFVP